MMNKVDPRNPILSYKAPLMDGPKKAPKANVDVHRPEIKPYVSMLSENPLFLMQVRNASVNVDTSSAPIPKPCNTRPMMIKFRLVSTGMNEAGPTKQNPIMMHTHPMNETSLGFRNLSTSQPQMGALRAYIPPLITCNYKFMNT